MSNKLDSSQAGKFLENPVLQQPQQPLGGLGGGAASGDSLDK